MLKNPEDMTPEELARFEKWMFEADEMCAERKRARGWREDTFADTACRIAMI